jgi:GNAT superfamily N-acetyltransferase
MTRNEDGKALSGSPYQIIEEYSKRKLVEATHHSWNSCMLLFSTYPRAEYRPTSRYQLFKSGLKIAMLNRVMHTSLRPVEADQAIGEVKQYYESDRLPFTWQVDPWDKPRDLAKKLEGAGFVREETPGMAVTIDEMVEPVKPDGFSYSRVDSPEKLDAYARLMVKAYGMPEHTWDWFVGGLKHIGVVDGFRSYIGYLDGKPVATSSILYSDGVAGLYNVATLPEARGRGIGGIISYVPFIDASERGYRFGVLHSTRMGYNVYKRIGFEEICKLIRYQWNPAEDAT